MSTVFDNLYMRPNLGNAGTVPPTGDLVHCPDIWCAGTMAVPDHKKALATPTSYASMSPELNTEGKDNYVYVRCRNNTAATVDQTRVQLFYARASGILWTADWHVVQAEPGGDAGVIVAIPSGGIGVVERPFIWSRPSTIEQGDHYCLIARLFQNDKDNPVPSVFSPIDLADVMATNLRWGKKNVTVLPANLADGYYRFNLDVPANVKGGSFIYHLYLANKGLAGYSYEVQASMADSEGRAISGRGNIVDDMDIPLSGTSFRFEPGFSTVISVFLYSNGAKPAPGASSTILFDYRTLASEMPRVRELGLGGYSARRKRLAGAHATDAPFDLVPLGGYGCVFE